MQIPDAHKAHKAHISLTKAAERNTTVDDGAQHRARKDISKLERLRKLDTHTHRSKHRTKADMTGIPAGMCTPTPDIGSNRPGWSRAHCMLGEAEEWLLKEEVTEKQYTRHRDMTEASMSCRCSIGPTTLWSEYSGGDTSEN